MCGLFGWMERPAITGHERSALRGTLAPLLAWVNDDRGGDSWGWFGSGGPDPVKGLGEMLHMKRKRMKRMQEQRWCIGHTRKASTGAVTIGNSHPFVAEGALGKVIGAHNGMVANHGWLNRSLGRKCEVDSQHLFLHLAEGGGLEEIEAYGAVAFVHDRGDGHGYGDTVFVGRFHEGELGVAIGKGFFAWSSSAYRLGKALRVAGLEAEIRKPKEGDLWSIAPSGIMSSPGFLSFREPMWAVPSAKKAAMLLTAGEAGTGGATLFPEAPTAKDWLDPGENEEDLEAWWELEGEEEAEEALLAEMCEEENAKAELEAMEGIPGYPC